MCYGLKGQSVCVESVSSLIEPYMYLSLKEKDVANVLSVVGRKAGEYILPRDESCLSLLQYTRSHSFS